ncbi:nucleoside 2-deoxyribosyltransferase [Methylocapsa palsarum]|uniref:Nucleoside 2-deoxyribosyltransferase n=1 Tax=Methylocapsa palsarum TaxID=1612308 RepID=A0A1I3YS17_9HYPH|nr:nucleoside 2-deoxyribosyltransferase [Methylocapsa palsarum]SFK34583.1 Nucleoside 2-deoxyribosyltransferase [Methylocapsa palsarum]
MLKRRKIYLAGPDVFLPNAIEIGERKKRLCEQFSCDRLELIGLFPFDNEIRPGADGGPVDRDIYRANLAMIKAADCGIFNLTPFRGPSADVGTVFELGLLTGLGKPAFAYSNECRSLLDRLKSQKMAFFDTSVAEWRDRNNMFIEDYGNSDNLMIDACLAEQGHPLVRRKTSLAERFADLGGYLECLQLARSHFLALHPVKMAASAS